MAKMRRNIIGIFERWKWLVQDYERFIRSSRTISPKGIQEFSEKVYSKAISGQIR